VIQLLLSGQVDHKTAGLALYGLQISSCNIRNTRLEPANKHSIVVDPETVDQTLMGDDLWNNADFDSEEEEIDEEETPDAVAEQAEQQVPLLLATILSGSLCSARDDRVGDGTA
jgi:hypothetical protein